MSGQQSFFIVDDNDQKSINYQTRDRWFPNFVQDDQAYQGTVTAGVAGAKASMRFQGTGIAVVGIVGPAPNVGPPAAQFSIDGTLLKTTVAPTDASADTQFEFFSVNNLDGSSIHEIDINVVNATTQYPFIMDYIIYLPSKGIAPTGSQSAVMTSLPSITAAPVGSQTDAKSSGAPVGAIVGGVVGGVALIVATCIAIWFLCFRRRRSSGQPFFYATSVKPGDLLDAETKPVPYEAHPQSVAYNLAPGSTHQSAPPSTPSAYSAPPSQYGPPSGLGYSTHTPSERPYSDYGSSVSGSSRGAAAIGLAPGSMPRSSTSPNQPRSKAAEAGLLSVPEQATYHADSGVRFDENGQPIPIAGASSSSAHPADPPVLADVPPTYSAT